MNCLKILKTYIVAITKSKNYQVFINHLQWEMHSLLKICSSISKKFKNWILILSSSLCGTSSLADVAAAAVVSSNSSWHVFYHKQEGSEALKTGFFEVHNSLLILYNQGIYIWCFSKNKIETCLGIPHAVSRMTLISTRSISMVSI